MLKESKELDRLLPDLLLLMGYIPISVPQLGVRQHGVDIASEFIDEKGKRYLVVFLVKQGDLGRSDWDSMPQSVRQTLDEIKDVYFEKIITTNQKKLAKKIILCTNGVLKQEVDENWKGYVDRNTRENQIEYELWNGYRLAQEIENNMLNEYSLLGDFRTKLRKTLVLLGDPDYSLDEFYVLLKENLLIVENDEKKIRKLISSIRLILNIIYHWSNENNNLKPALYAAERTLLNMWEIFRKNNLLNDVSLLKLFGLIFQDFVSICVSYFNKINSLCYEVNGFNGYSHYYLLENIGLFEQLGIIAIIGLNHFYYGAIFDDKTIICGSENVKDSLKAFISNHSSISSPIYDDHIIEIVLALILLGNFNEVDFIEKWINEIYSRIEFAYNVLGKYFPVYSDSLEDSVLLSYDSQEGKEKMMCASTMLLILLEVSAVFRFENLYKKIFDSINIYFKQTTLQIWYPDATTDDYLYTVNAGYASSLAFVPKSIPSNVEDMNKIIIECHKKYIDKNKISSINKGFMILPLIASRHFRTPILPLYWSMFIYDENGMSKQSMA